MIALSLAEIADIVGGELRDASAARRTVDGVTIDSRTAGPGTLFVALPGTRTDGHRFVTAAVTAGAAAALVAADRVDDIVADAPVVVVDDPADALLGLGAWVRDTVDPLVIGITGSNGKTTTKDLIAAAARSRRTVANEGSFNNELGVPLTCCRLVADTELLVCEIGMRGSGQIAELAGLLRPSIGVVTSVAEVHLELLGSLEAIAAAKGELVEALPPDGVAVLSADDPLVAAMRARTQARTVTFGRSPAADWRARDVVPDDGARARFTLDSPYGGAVVRVPVPGLHNVGNALAALASTVESGVDLEDAVAGLEQATVSRWRLQLQHVAGVRVLNDAYNANPTSMVAALETLSRLPTDGRRWAVLGTMAEIGATSEQEHRRIGAVAAELGIDGLVTVGPVAAAIRDGANAADPDGAPGRWSVADVDAAATLLASSLNSDDVVLVKASRSAALDGVVARLERRLSTASANGSPPTGSRRSPSPSESPPTGSLRSPSPTTERRT
jgi:UDP-N-acetylmuramoyl-tripeptide--D-alanyl-D-alanine ligase